MNTLYNEENQRYEGTITNGKSITGNDLDLVFGSDPVECNGENVYITSIGWYVFRDSGTYIYPNIRSVTFKSGGIKTIGVGAFYTLNSIQTIIIEDNSVESIGQNAFILNPTTSIYIASSISSIGSYAFDPISGCTIALNWTSFDNLDLASGWINDKSSSVIIKVPDGYESTYYKNRERLGIDGCTIYGYTPTSNIGLAVGLGVGLGVPAVGGIGFGIYYGVKRKKNKK